jgi:hypothetical protein
LPNNTKPVKWEEGLEVPLFILGKCLSYCVREVVEFKMYLRTYRALKFNECHLNHLPWRMSNEFGVFEGAAGRFF